MKKLFMIKEFAKLRNVHVNSLLYYEKLGLLKPAYINPATNYRYYSAEQLPTLDMIIMCIQLEIPLKEMKSYIDQDGNLDFQEFLLHGQKLAQKRMNDIQKNLIMIDRFFHLMEDHNKNVLPNTGYRRHLEERHIIISDFFQTPGTLSEAETAIKNLYETAQKSDVIPLLPAGVILHCVDEHTIKYCVFLEIIALNSAPSDQHRITLPKGEYPCVKVQLHVSSRPAQEIEQYWKWTPGMTVVVQNMYSEKYDFSNTPSEFQKIPVFS